MKFANWENFDEKMKCRAIEELLRFMAIFSTTAAMICFFATILKGGDMNIAFILLVFMAIMDIGWVVIKRKNEARWGVAKRTNGREVFRIGLTQPTEEERKGIKPEPEKKPKKKKTTKKKAYK